MVYILAEDRRKGSGIISALFFIASLVFFEGNYFLAEPFVAFLIVLAFFLLGRRNYIVAGIFAGASLLFKQTALPSVFVVSVFAFYKTTSKERLHYLFGAALIPLLSVSWTLITGVQQEAFRQIITLNFTAYPAESISLVAKNLAPVFMRTWWLWIFAIYGILRSKKEYPLLFLVLVPMPLFFVRAYPHYWIQILPFVAVFAGIGFSLILENFPKLQIVIMSLVILGLWQNFLWFYWIEKYVDWPKLKEQKQLTEYLKTKPQNQLLAENQFTGYYFLSEKKPLTKYLYITEINRGEGAEEKTIKALGNDVIILWPPNLDFAYAKKLQEIVISRYQKSREYPALGVGIWETSGQ